MICSDCFDSENIYDYIHEKGEEAPPNYECEECGARNHPKVGDLHIMSKAHLATKLKQVINNLYTHIYVYVLPNHATESYIALEEVCWNLFENEDKLAALISENSAWETADGGDGFFDDINTPQWLDTCWLTPDNFDWEYFSKKVKHSLRFFDTGDFSRTEELEKLDRIFEKLDVTDIDRTVYRARGIGQYDIEKVNNSPAEEIGKAPPKVAGHNRFSPSGISYIYLASDEQTAVYEVYEESKALYAIGSFELKEDLKFLDLRKSLFNATLKRYTDPFSDDFDPVIFCAYKALMQFIDDIQKPIKNHEKHLEYLPTQVLAEYIRLKGYDGFIFDSSKKCSGYNIVLFDDQMGFMEHHIKNVTMTSIVLKISDIGEN